MATIPTAAGTVIFAGHDSFVMRDGRWYRPLDDTWHTVPDVQDFHGHSGFTVLA